MSRLQAKRVEPETLAPTSFLHGGTATYIEGLQRQFDADPSSINPDWQRFFKSLARDPEFSEMSVNGPVPMRTDRPPSLQHELATISGRRSSVVPAQIGERASGEPGDGGLVLSGGESLRARKDSIRAFALIEAYRCRGHLVANLDPLGLKQPELPAELDPATYGFAETDLDRIIFVDGELGIDSGTLREILELLRRLYCSTIGYDLAQVSDTAQKAWLQERVEGPQRDMSLDAPTKLAILSALIEAKGYERYLDKQFVGTKRFGLDGAEATIPALEQILRSGAMLGVTEVVLGMAHRGRLNVLSQILRKPHRAIFSEFRGGTFIPEAVRGSGDVKYHLGASSDREFDGRTVHLSLVANPSHLEISDPVVLGKVRAKQDQNQDTLNRITVLPLLIHGDAAFAGQGVVAECLGLSGLKGYTTGGSVHLIINNQIGFTTDPACSRSSTYPSDLAKMIEAPIFHVNGDDPEAVVRVARLAVEYRQRFHKPVVIDMFCFRFYGHNEADEPAFTQPQMYQRVRSHKSTLEIYSEQLIAQGIITQAKIDSQKDQWVHYLDSQLEASLTYVPDSADWLAGRWQGLTPQDASENDATEPAPQARTGIARSTLDRIGRRLTQVPEGFQVHPTIQRFLAARRKMFEAGTNLDWSTAEALAFGTLATQGHPIRLSGQDSERGTFSQRHAVLIDQETGRRHIPLNHLSEHQANCEILNSMLSEEAVLGFEYGYTLAEPNALVLWEAQFGDFANGAQVIFDQFLSSAERKWLRMSGLVCLLPHGYDGQGPEHSSARLERYLQSCAEENWQVVNCTTPANYFHVLRRQLERNFRKPLILMTPKSLLRHPRCKSDMSDITEGTAFQCLLKDGAEINPSDGFALAEDAKIRRVVLCSGKVYYNLIEEREKRGIDDVYLLRIEQLYPFPTTALARELARFTQADLIWCQEEPRNMGGWSFVEPLIERALAQALRAPLRARYVGRQASASPATGQVSRHQRQLQAFLDQAFEP